MIKKIWRIIIFLIFLILIYTSKTDYYESKKEFYKRSFSSEIEKMIGSRGTRVYYKYFGKESYFYLHQYEGIELKVADVIRKNEDVITIMRKDKNGEYAEVGKGKSLKPEESYFQFFFN